MSLTAIKRNIQLTELEPWGTVADLGANVLEGEARCFGKMTAGAPTDAVSSAYFGVTGGRFRMVYPFSEQATVLTGQVTLTEEATGQRTTFNEGDTWYVKKGTAVLWEVPAQGFVKHYYAVA